MYILASIEPIGRLALWSVIIILMAGWIRFMFRVARSLRSKEEYIGTLGKQPRSTATYSLKYVVAMSIITSILLYCDFAVLYPNELFYPIKEKVVRQYTFVYFYTGSTEEMPATKTNAKGNGFVKLKFHINYELTRQIDSWFWQDSIEVINTTRKKLADMMPELDLHSSRSILFDLWKTNPIKNVSLNYLAYPEASKATNDRFMRNTGATKALFSYVIENDKGKKTFGMTEPIEIKTDETSVESGNSYSVRIPFQQQTTTTIATMTFTYTNTHSATVSAKITSPNTGKDMLIKADCDFEYQAVAKKVIPEGEHTMDELHEQFGSKIRKAVSIIVDNHGNQIAVSVAYQLQPELSEVNRDFLQSANIRHTPYDKLAELLTSRLRDKLSNDKEATVNYIRLEVNNITAEIVPTE